MNLVDHLQVVRFRIILASFLEQNITFFLLKNEIGRVNESSDDASSI